MAKDIVRQAAPKSIELVEKTSSINWSFPIFPVVGILAIVALYLIKK